MVRFESLSLFLLLALLSGCAAPAPIVSSIPFSTDTLPPVVIPSSTPTETPTATEVPKPLGAENLPQNVKLVLNKDGSWGIKIGNEAKAIPGAVFDSTGLHMTLDTGRIVDISPSELQKRTAYDQDLNLFKIYDDQGIISAEYDPGVGQPNTPDYIPGQGWVDMQKLADEACNSTSTCFRENVQGLPSGTVEVEYASTGIFRKINAIDSQTNNPVGKFLLLQFVTQNTTKKPTIGWQIVQANDSQGGYTFSLSHIMQRNYGIPLDDGQTLQPIEQWQSWMPKGSLWKFGFLKSGNLQWWFWTQNHLAPVDYQDKVTQFLTSKGDISFNSIYPLMFNSHSPR